MEAFIKGGSSKGILKLYVLHTNNQKNITFTMSNGLQIHILETSVFRAHMRILAMAHRLNWNLEVVDIKI